MAFHRCRWKATLRTGIANEINLVYTKELWPDIGRRSTTIHMDGKKMANNVHDLRLKAGDTEQTGVGRVDLGLRHYSRDDPEVALAAGRTYHIHALGRATIASITVPGAPHANPAVKAAPADSMR
jgi:hypothetical protein